MQPHSQEFSFCFSLRKLTMLDVGASGWENYLRFRIEIYRHEHFVSSTPDILCTPNQDSQIILKEENVTFTLHLPDLTVKESAEVRLYETAQGGQAKLVGCYQFLLNNYVRAYQELNRNCIELHVQIAENYIIVYDVFIERTEQALHRLIHEHETARRFHMDGDDISEIDSFLPHEISNHNLQQIYREIKINDASPILHHHRYWSPKRQRGGAIGEEAQKAENSHSTIVSENTRLHSRKLHKAITSANMSFSLERREADEVESQAEAEDRFKTFDEVYRVIGSESKIIQPDELEEHVKTRIANQIPTHFPPPSLKTSKRLNSAHSTLKGIVITALVITLAAFLGSAFQASDQHYKVRAAKGIKAKH